MVPQKVTPSVRCIQTKVIRYRITPSASLASHLYYAAPYLCNRILQCTLNAKGELKRYLEHDLKYLVRIQLSIPLFLLLNRVWTRDRCSTIPLIWSIKPGIETTSINCPRHIRRAVVAPIRSIRECGFVAQKPSQRVRAVKQVASLVRGAFHNGLHKAINYILHPG